MEKMTNCSVVALLQRAKAAPKSLSREELATLISVEDPDACAALYEAAYEVKLREIGPYVSVRGLIEAGNVCTKNCFYCGIRASNKKVMRYQLTAAEILSAAAASNAAGITSLVIQSGEVQSPAHTAFITDILNRLRPLDLGITLSLGEQPHEAYAAWRKAGAARYLLRIETSCPLLYRAFHPASHRWKHRVKCLKALKALGYQLGTGVMCGLPFQTFWDLAGDILFYDTIDADMIGMGPYIPHPDTPLAHMTIPSAERRLTLGLNMIAATRLYLHDVNIASTTALEVLSPRGRELGLKAGANVIMPNITDTKWRESYSLYAGKPSGDESPAKIRENLSARLAEIGETILFNQRGDSKHYHKRNEE